MKEFQFKSFKKLILDVQQYGDPNKIIYLLQFSKIVLYFNMNQKIEVDVSLWKVFDKTMFDWMPQVKNKGGFMNISYIQSKQKPFQKQLRKSACSKTWAVTYLEVQRVKNVNIPTESTGLNPIIYCFICLAVLSISYMNYFYLSIYSVNSSGSKVYIFQRERDVVIVSPQFITSSPRVKSSRLLLKNCTETSLCINRKRK